MFNPKGISHKKYGIFICNPTVGIDTIFHVYLIGHF